MLEFTYPSAEEFSALLNTLIHTRKHIEMGTHIQFPYASPNTLLEQFSTQPLRKRDLLSIANARDCPEILH